jgi:chaperonin GroES
MIEPLNDILWIIPEESKTASGIIVAHHQQTIGTVAATGPGRLFRTADGVWSREPLTVQPGHRVAFSHNAGQERRVNGTDYLVMRESDIHAILHPEADVAIGENRKGWGM